MSVDKRVCKDCGEEFILTPDKPGYVNKCPNCSSSSKRLTISEVKARVREWAADWMREDGKSEAEIEMLISEMGEFPLPWYVDFVKEAGKVIDSLTGDDVPPSWYEDLLKKKLTERYPK
jgi:DNA-directed RNA polymerase subunit RPC12/RpoP